MFIARAWPLFYGFELMLAVWAVLFFLGIFGIGILFVPSHVPLSQSARFFLSGALGVSVLQSLVYLGLPLSWAACLIWAGVFIGLVKWVSKRSIAFSKESWMRGFGLSLLALIPALVLLIQQQLTYDARVIWFFHGKLIFEHHGIFGPVWTEPSFAFTHPDYPKFIGILAALFAKWLGRWSLDEVKLCLLFPLLLCQIGIFSLRLSNRWVLLFDFVVLASTHYLLWNGQMDGYVAFFALLAAVFLGQHLRSGDLESLWCAVGCLGLLPQIKNEGAVLAVVLAGLFLLQPGSAVAVRSIGRDWRVYLLFVPTLAWLIVRKYLHIENYLVAGFRSDLPLSRLGSAAFWLDFGEYYWLRAGIVFPFLLFVGVAFWRWKTPFFRIPEVRLAFLGGLLYSAILVAVYLCTSWIVRDHLNASFNRVGLSVSFLWLVATLFLLQTRSEQNERQDT